MTQVENKQVRLSVIVAAWNGISLLRECLSSLEKQAKETEAEVIVVSNFESGIYESKELFSFAKYFILSAEATVPQLRSHGINQARGPIVALIEDLCTTTPHWCREIVIAHELSHDIVGGTVENSCSQNALDWAVYFYDYGKYMLPVQKGITNTLSGMNVSYKKEILKKVQEKYQNGFFEIFINEELKRCGYKLYLTPTAIVYHNKNYNLKTTALQFFHQARSFAAAGFLMHHFQDV
jgi:GT2 family glycosyltransferase